MPRAKVVFPLPGRRQQDHVTHAQPVSRTLAKRLGFGRRVGDLVTKVVVATAASGISAMGVDHPDRRIFRHHSKA